MPLLVPFVLPTMHGPSTLSAEATDPRHHPRPRRQLSHIVNSATLSQLNHTVKSATPSTQPYVHRQHTHTLHTHAINAPTPLPQPRPSNQPRPHARSQLTHAVNSATPSTQLRRLNSATPSTQLPWGSACGEPMRIKPVGSVQVYSGSPSGRGSRSPVVEGDWDLRLHAEDTT